MKKNRVTFGIIGGGWRARHFLQAAKQIPGRFRVGGVLLRDAAEAELLRQEFGVNTYLDFDDFLSNGDMAFIVIAVASSVKCAFIRKVAERGIPILSETPPGTSMDELLALNGMLHDGPKFQVAEQYQFQPLLAAQIAFIRTGKLGTVRQAQVSVAHGFHGTSLVRKMLSVGFENARISGRKFVSPVWAGPGRDGPPDQERVDDFTQVIVQLDFGNKLGIIDLDPAQYMFWIRGSRVLIRGEKGEICNETVRYMKDFRTPVRLELLRQDASTKEGLGHQGYLAGEEWIYRSPFQPVNPFESVRLNDDELAMATCLDKMADYVDGGPEFYGLADSLQDTYLSFMIDKALETGEEVTTETQPWG